MKLKILSVLAIVSLGLALGISPVPASAKPVLAKYSPAKWSGTPKCSSKYKATKKHDKAFLHVLNKTCYSCPKGYKRTLNPNVKSKKACKRKGKSYYKKAKKHNKGKLLKKCPKGQFLHAFNKTCYSCPSSYKRTVSKISSAKACKKSTNAKHARASRRGKAGCRKGAFRHGLRNACYTCPKKYIRTIAGGKDLSKVRKACAQYSLGFKPKFSPKFFKWAKAESRKIKKTYDPLIKQAVKFSKIMNTKKIRRSVRRGTDAKKKKVLIKISADFRRWAQNWLSKKKKASLGLPYDGVQVASADFVNSHDFNTDGYDPMKGMRVAVKADEKGLKTFSLGWAVDGSLLYGMTAVPQFYAWDWTSDKKGGKGGWYASLSNSAGITAGVDLAPEFGFWWDKKSKLEGKGHGFVVGAAVKGGAALAFWWSYGKKKTGKKTRFLGFTVTPQIGLSAEAEYTWGETIKY